MSSPFRPDNRQSRVFISSALRDMHTERGYLLTVAFPEFRERVEPLGLEFFDVDLRFRRRQERYVEKEGIIHEAGSDLSTMRICWAEIAPALR
jgi:hypothetical protein